jgi:hypothetical protein
MRLPTRLRRSATLGREDVSSPLPSPHTTDRPRENPTRRRACTRARACYCWCWRAAFVVDICLSRAGRASRNRDGDDGCKPARYVA